MAHAVTTRSECLVRPSSATPPQHMFLSAADTFWRHFHYNQRILFFKLGDSPFDVVVAHLKSSLATVLVPFFPWAGRIFKQESGRLALDCNDAGVAFIEAYVDLRFSSLENDGFKHQNFFQQFAPHGNAKKWTSPDIPLLSVQVTRFCDDEGFVLGIGHSHVVADGSSLWHFMKSWGECGRGVSVSMQPIHIREALRPENLIVPPFNPQDEDMESGPPEDDSDLVQQDFHFTAETVKKLKRMATDSCPAGHGPFSSLQSLSAHLWKHRLEATDVEGSTECIYHVISNMRSRLKPPLPEAYFGNVIVRDGAIATKEEILQETIGATALRIQELTKKIDATYFRTFYGNSEVLSFMKLYDPAIFTMVSLQISSSPRFPVYDVDFGWGAPILVRSPHIRGEGEMVWFCGREEEGSIDVSIALPKPVMERLERDKRFLTF